MSDLKPLLWTRKLSYIEAGLLSLSVKKQDRNLSTGKLLTSFVLPATALIIIPALLQWNLHYKLHGIEGLKGFGIMPIIMGSFMLGWTVSIFALKGNGTLAPWHPPESLVLSDPYAHVRNPMISAVVTLLFGEAIWLDNLSILIWAGLFLSMNHLYFVLSEEPDLEKRLGSQYLHYKKQVRRWVPKITKYKADNNQTGVS